MSILENIRTTVEELAKMGIPKRELHIVLLDRMAREEVERIAEQIGIIRELGSPPAVPNFLGIPYSTVPYRQDLWVRASCLERELLRTVICVDHDGTCKVIFQSTWQKSFEEVEKTREAISRAQEQVFSPSKLEENRKSALERSGVRLGFQPAVIACGECD